MSQFVPVPGYPKYKVNKQGVVLGQNGKPLKPRPLAPSRPGNQPYHMVALYGSEGRRDRSVHHIVLETFVGPREHDQEARHLNGDVSDNRLKNLAWGTREENGADKIKHRPRCSKCGKKLKGRNLMMAKNGKGDTRVRRCRSCHNRRTLAYNNAKNRQMREAS